EVLRQCSGVVGELEVTAGCHVGIDVRDVDAGVSDGTAERERVVHRRIEVRRFGVVAEADTDDRGLSFRPWVAPVLLSEMSPSCQGFGSRGRPRIRSPITFFMISSVPPAMRCDGVLMKKVAQAYVPHSPSSAVRRGPSMCPATSEMRDSLFVV